MNHDTRTREEEQLDRFVGEWCNSGQMMPGPYGPGGPITGTTRYGWEMGSRWLVYVSHLILPGSGAYEVQGGVGFNRVGRKYDAYAVNNLGNILVYEGEWTDGPTLVFTAVYPAPAGRARVSYRTMPGGVIRMSSELVSDKGVFEPYFVTDMEPC